MFKPFDLTGKVAVVTGGNGGIGLGMAEGLAQAGADVAIWGTNEEKNKAAEAKLKTYGKRVLAQKVDVSKEAEVVAAMDEVVKTFGRVDSVFANAGIGGARSPFWELDIERFRKIQAVNTEGAMFTLREGAKHMVARAKAGEPGGSLCVVASLAGIEGAAQGQSYGSSKGAVMAMVRSIAVELARYGIRANSIAPGWIATDMFSRAINPTFTSKVMPRVPVRRWGTPEDFAGIAVYLTSDASAYQTGTTQVIDGGYQIF